MIRRDHSSRVRARHVRVALAVLALPGLAAMAVAQEGVIPEGYPSERYSLIWEKSPFTLSSAAEQPVQASFTSNLTLVGLGTINDMPYARLLDKASQQRFTVGAEAPHDGIELVSVDPSDDPLESSARLRKGGEVGEVRFDPALLAAASVSAPSPAQQAAANKPPPQRQATARNPANQRQAGEKEEIPRPRRRRVIIPSSRN